MKELSHQNVMSIIGVCLDAGTAPFIILPYMSGITIYTYIFMIFYALNDRRQFAFLLAKKQKLTTCIG